ncbi:serum response factor-binding protein 1 isoform X2 [Bombina bombina]|uniref:serum response factor-binding protein 1 isoform X2 n=1 Tax=Bombina bombina TaxID=8345 RepID=UPI00235A6A98|nr:serum response factor-binding protein 1 isoform X2 [Bombina bombina]
MAPVLNLNNEVVKMRKDVKKVKVLTIRKLTRHNAKLKSKKGTEELLQKNQRRAQRLLEEIQAIKEVKPDDVTKTALQKEINFEKICKKPGSTVQNRAIARLATHPLLRKKITTIKEAVKAFKDARRNISQEEKLTVKENKTEQTCPQSEPAKALATDRKDQNKLEKEKETRVEKRKKEQSKLEKDNLINLDPNTLKESDAPSENQSNKKKGLCIEQHLQIVPSADVTEMKVDEEEKVPKESGAEDVTEIKVDEEEKVPKEIGAEDVTEMKVDEKEKVSEENGAEDGTEIKIDEEERVPKENASLVHDGKKDSSDIEASDNEEKEYFDDSTEERFYKHSSGFEDSSSESDNNFFIGKVKRTKKKKSDKKCSGDAQKKEQQPLKDELKKTDAEEPKGRHTEKHVKLTSLFCNSLSQTKKKPSLLKRETNVSTEKSTSSAVPQSNTHVKEKLPNKSPFGKQQKNRQEPLTNQSLNSSKNRREPQYRKPQLSKSPAVKQQSKFDEKPLHPSWEASRKRKEQLSQITAFQGKKIIFDD